MVSKWGETDCPNCGIHFTKEYKWNTYCSKKCRKEFSYKKRVIGGRRKDILRKFGITLEEYNALLIKQNGVCAICQCKEKAKSVKGDRIKELAVDHSHKTGKIRGLLCMSCNKGLGSFDDDINKLYLAIKYLEEK